jgi:hypothetical protein
MKRTGFTFRVNLEKGMILTLVTASRFPLMRN